MITVPWHELDDIPTLDGQPIINYQWMNIYRSMDWGYFPDPAVCLWTAVLPNKRSIVFKERTWKKTLAEDVAKDIKKESYGMHIVETFCDPTMDIKSGETAFSIRDIFERNGIPLTLSINRRDLLGYAIHQYLNNIIDNRPQLQIVKGMGPVGCPNLIRTLPEMRMDPTDATKMAAGDDHWVIALAYFCAGSAAPSQNPVQTQTPQWMRPKQKRRTYV